MRKVIIYIFFLTQTLISFGQTQNNNKILITNNQNFELSPFANVILNKKITKYNFVMRVNIGWGKYYSKRDAEIFGVEEYKLNTALDFTKIGEDSIVYYYPISNNFKYSKKSQQLKLGKDMKLKFFTKIYKTESTPVVIIECIKLEN